MKINYIIINLFNNRHKIATTKLIPNDRTKSISSFSKIIKNDNMKLDKQNIPYITNSYEISCLKKSSHSNNQIKKVNLDLASNKTNIPSTSTISFENNINQIKINTGLANKKTDYPSFKEISTSPYLIKVNVFFINITIIVIENSINRQ